MSQNLSLTKSVRINVPAARVWEGLTDPKLIEQYFFGSKTITDWQEGSDLIYTGTWEGKEYEDRGIILEAKPGKILRHTYLSSFSGLEDKPENYNELTYTLDEQDGSTLLTVKQDNIRDEQSKEHSDQNWDVVLNNMKQLLENKQS